MSSRSSASLLLIVAFPLAVSACDREEHHSRAKPFGETVPSGESPQTIFPGSSSPPPLDVRAKLYDNNANAISQGQQLYMQMNCVGCHSHGGGGMGPPLMDDEWRYGSRSTRSPPPSPKAARTACPSWRGKLTEDQIWDLAAYVRSMSALPQQGRRFEPRRRDERPDPADAHAQARADQLGRRAANDRAPHPGSPCTAAARRMLVPALSEHLRRGRRRGPPVPQPVLVLPRRLRADVRSRDRLPRPRDRSAADEPPTPMSSRPGGTTPPIPRCGARSSAGRR